MKKILILGIFICSTISNLYSQNSQEDTLVNVFDLDETVVTATRTEKKLKNVPILTQVITSKQIEARSITDVRGLLEQEVPGLNFQEVGFGASIDIQGLGAKHILFLIDGERIAGENGGNIDYSRINVYDIERIEIVKGAASALYGSQAMGGVINIITKQAKEKYELSADFKYMGRNQKNFDKVDKDDFNYNYKKNLDKENINASVNLGLNFEKIKSHTSLLYKSFDGYQLFDKTAQDKYFPEYDTLVKTEINKVPTSISGYEDFQISQRISSNITDKFKLTAKGSYYILNKYDFQPDNIFEQSEDFNYGLGLEYHFSENSILSANYYADHYSRFDKYEKKEGRNLDYRNVIMQPRLMWSYSKLKNQIIIVGAEAVIESLYGDKFEYGVWKEKKQWSSTLYAQHEWSILKNLSTTIGLRADYRQDFGFSVTPKASLMYKPGPVTLRLNYANGYRSPSLKELYMDWDHLGMFWIYGNPDLKPETNHYLSFSTEYSNSFMNLSANVYANWFKDKIEGVWSKNQTEYRYTNIGKSSIYGLEVLGKFRVCDYLNVYGAYNFIHVPKNSEGVQLTSSSPHSGNLRLESVIHWLNNKTQINIIGRFTGSKKFDVLGELSIDDKNVESYYNVQYPMYMLWDITVAQSFWKNSIILSAGVLNLFNYKADLITFNTSTSMGINFSISCKIMIDKMISNFKK